MAYVSVQDSTQPATSPITGIFASPQNAPAPAGYIGQIADADARIATFIAAQQIVLSGSSG